MHTDADRPEALVAGAGATTVGCTIFTAGTAVGAYNVAVG